MVMAIKERRKTAGLTQQQLAVNMDVTQGTVANWESENILPKTRDLPLLAKVLGCAIGELFAESE